MVRKKETITLSIPPGTKALLEEIAMDLGITWGSSPSISGLIVAIAQKKIEIGSVLTLNAGQVEATMQAIRLLADSGYIGDAQVLVLFLLENANLEVPLRKLLLEQVSNPSEPWRRVIDQQISEKQPFCLVYEDSQGQQQEFTVRYCEIRFWEKRFYLEALCDEAVNRSGLPELVHNRCFRLDRIINILPISGSWKNQLECINVEFSVLGRLIKAYEPQPDDIESETIDGILHVVRRVSNTFWFIREVLRYGENCVITSPPSVREQLVEKLKELCVHYDISS